MKYRKYGIVMNTRRVLQTIWIFAWSKPSAHWSGHIMTKQQWQAERWDV